ISACGPTARTHAPTAATTWPPQARSHTPTSKPTQQCSARHAERTVGTQSGSRTPPAPGAHDDDQARHIRDRVPVVAIPVPRRAMGPERTHHRTRAQSPVGTKARTYQEQEDHTMTGAAWL